MKTLYTHGACYTVLRTAVTAALILTCSDPAWSQVSKSAPLAKELVQALEAAKMDSIAAKDPSASDVYVGALYIAGLQLLSVSGRYAVPTLLDTRLGKKEYRDIYLDLNGASPPESRVFVEDLGADGLKARREENQAFDSVERQGKRTTFDSDWRRQKLSEEEYMKLYAEADDKYAQMLTALLAQLKKTS
jgi:hypothetical protein